MRAHPLLPPWLHPSAAHSSTRMVCCVRPAGPAIHSGWCLQWGLLGNFRTATAPSPQLMLLLKKLGGMLRHQ
jgi:hypothetical protein